MKNNFKIILTAIIAVLIGLGAGYFIFGNGSHPPAAMEAPDHPPEASTTAGEEIWTCSMHPQIRQNEAGDCALCGMDLIPLEDNSSSDPLVLEMTPDAVKLAHIQTSIIGEGVGASGKIIRLSGKVQADERLASSQVAHVPGRIEKLFVSFTGEQVEAGQEIARLYSPELITAQRELLEALKLQEISPGLLEAARNKLRYWKIGNSTIERIEQQGKIQETFTVYAEESGIVRQKKVAVGDYVQQGQALFELMNLSKVWVLFDAYEEDLAAIHVGDKIEFSTPSLANETLQTRVTFIDPIINPNTRVASIRTEVQNRKGLLKPEMLVYGNLERRSKSNTQWSIPKTAVLWTGKRSVVYVKMPDRKIPSFQFRTIEIGEAQGDTYQVLSGLEAGEEVVTYGSFAIDAAAQLNNQASMMNQNVVVKNESRNLALPDYTRLAPTAFKRQLAAVSDAYLLLKDALVATDGQLATRTARQVLEALGKVDKNLLEADPQGYWMDQLLAMESHGGKISALDDVEAQRKQFDFLSQLLIESIKVFGVVSDTLYVQHCPMVNGNQGADWLSREDKVRNPYFGDKMMTCGVVKTTIDKDFKNP